MGQSSTPELVKPALNFDYFDGQLLSFEWLSVKPDSTSSADCHISNEEGPSIPDARFRAVVPRELKKCNCVVGIALTYLPE
jgi:hypothetical protein